jgi:CheY-like chemotaxis protein/PAS domain-containing protein
LPDKPKILFVGEPREHESQLAARVEAGFEIVRVQSMIRALSRLKRDQFAGVYVGSDQLQQAFQIGRLLQNERILDSMTDGVVLLDGDNTVIWANERLREWTNQESVTGANFYTLLGSPEILGPDFCPFHTALATGKPSCSTLRSEDNRYFEVHAVPVCENEQKSRNLIVTVHDVTSEKLQQQKLNAIHRAGVELADMLPEELAQMAVDERIDLLKSNILHYTQDLLNFEVVEIRLSDPKTGMLRPLLSVGIEPEAAQRTLHANPQHNGVTGFVAATGKSYLCEDTTEDPLYLEGAKGAKSSLTVPLILHDEVIGTFNVESPEAQAFTESDLQFLEIFSRDVAVALNTLDLLMAEKAITSAESVEKIHSAVALPVDDILNDAVNVMERYIGHDPEVVQRLQNILRNTRDIKQVIHQVGKRMSPGQAIPQPSQDESHPRLRGRQVLVADADESVRGAAHSLLERYGCVVETAHDGNEAVSMIRHILPTGGYDVIIADINLSDMNGYEFMMKLKAFVDPVPLILMTGFGYDPGHSIVKARQAGLQAVLYKPFRIDQLLETVEKVVSSTSAAETA